jgi:hypothetical protein
MHREEFLRDWFAGAHRQSVQLDRRECALPRVV